MYREIERTNGTTETTNYGLAHARQTDDTKNNASIGGDQPEALFAAVSFAALLVILLVSALQAWL
jgi:hypothetical protein